MNAMEAERVPKTYPNSASRPDLCNRGGRSVTPFLCLSLSLDSFEMVGKCSGQYVGTYSGRFYVQNVKCERCLISAR